MVEKYFKVDHLVKSYECDMQGWMTLPQLILQFIQLSAVHSQAVNDELGYDPLEESQLNWIIIRYQVDIQQPAQLGQQVQLATESVTHDKLFSYRNFDLLDQEGKQMAHVEAVFALMDPKKRRMVRMKSDYVQAYPFKEPVRKKIKRYPDPALLQEGQEDGSKEYRVRYFDIDSNQHVNNSLYLTWALDALDIEFLTNHQLTAAIIKFEKEVFYGQCVQSKVKIASDQQGLYSTHRIECEGKLNAEIEYRWSERNK